MIEASTCGGWLAYRIESMIQLGLLVPVTVPALGRSVYHRVLKKA